MSKDELIRKCRQFQASARYNPRLRAKAKGIWSLESLGFSFANPKFHLAMGTISLKRLQRVRFWASVFWLQAKELERSRL
jgi:hypothetical protein